MDFIYCGVNIIFTLNLPFSVLEYYGITEKTVKIPVCIANNAHHPHHYLLIFPKPSHLHHHDNVRMLCRLCYWSVLKIS